MSFLNLYNYFSSSSNLSATERIVFTICLIGFLSCITISYSLWFPINNIYSPNSVFTLFETDNSILHICISTLFIISLVFAGIQKKIYSNFIYLFSLLLVISLLLDQLRWQPWCYYFLFIFLAFAVFPEQHQKKKLDSIRIILAFIYIWSGIQKFNYAFFFEVYPWLLEPITDLLSEDFENVINATFIFAPVVEFGAGLGLLFRKTQKFGAYLLIIMHLFILIMIGPLGHNSNIVVWPWNITFMILLGVLFLRKHSFAISKVFQKSVSLYHLLLIIVFGFLPFLSFFGAWPMYFSSALYSGNTVNSRIYFPESLNPTLPSYITSKIDSTDNSTRLGFFVQNETNVPIYPETKFHINTFKKFCNRYKDIEQELVLVLFEKPNVLTGKKIQQTLFCDEFESFD